MPLTKREVTANESVQMCNNPSLTLSLFKRNRLQVIVGETEVLERFSVAWDALMKYLKVCYCDNIFNKNRSWRIYN